MSVALLRLMYITEFVACLSKPCNAAEIFFEQALEGNLLTGPIEKIGTWHCCWICVENES